MRGSIRFAVVAVIVVSACSGKPPTTTEVTSSAPVASSTAPVVRDLSWMTRTVDSLAANLECTQRVRYEDDLYFWDRAVGISCARTAEMLSPHDVITVFAYQHSGSPAASLTNAGGLISQNDPVLLSDHVLAFGTKAELEVMQTTLKERGESPRIITSLPKLKQLTDRQEALGSCAGFAASSMATYAEGKPESASDIAELDQIYPGYAALIADLYASKQIPKRVGSGSKDQLIFEGTISTFGPKIKKFCASSAGVPKQ